MFDKSLRPKGSKVTEEDLANTPPAVLELLLFLIKRNEKLEARLNENSSNSNKPSSTDSPYKKKTSKKTKGTKRKERKGYRQQMLPPTETRKIEPLKCSCGCHTFRNKQPYYTHQHIELPEIVMTVIHFILYQAECTACGKINTGYLPSEYSTGFGPRFSALIAELGGIQGNSREII